MAISLTDKKGLLNKLYLWIEKLFTSVTDVLMVMNSTDYQLAIKYQLGKKIELIPGMGIDLSKFSKVSTNNKENLKVKAGFDSNDFLIIYAAEMSKRKNQGELIRAFALCAVREPRLKLLLAGDGILKDHYEKMVKNYGISERVIFLGHVKDMVLIYQMCDLSVSTSRCEGLPFNVMEAMASGLPVIASRIKGHVDLLCGLQQCFLYTLAHEQELANMLLELYHNDTLRKKLEDQNITNIQQYGLDEVRPTVIENYSSFTKFSSVLDEQKG